VQNYNRYFTGAAEQGIFISKAGKEFDGRDQNFILGVVQGGWFLMMVCGQATHIWVCRTTTVSIFEQGVFSNRVTNIGVLVSVGIGCLITYTPGLQLIVNSGNANSLTILYGTLIAGGLLWTYTEARKYFTRNYPDHHINKYLAW
jgi:sodium/potassium-transporting ATPase subunit alpha